MNESSKQPWDMPNYKLSSQASVNLHPPQQQNQQHQLSSIFKSASVNRQQLQLEQRSTAPVLEAARASSTNQLKQNDLRQQALTTSKQASANQFDPHRQMSPFKPAPINQVQQQGKPNPRQQVLTTSKQVSANQQQFNLHQQTPTFKSAPINQNQQQDKPDPRQQVSTTFKQASTNQCHNPQQKQSGIKKSTNLHTQPHGQYWDVSQPRNSSSESVRRRGQVFAWKSPISKQPTEESVVSSPPMGLTPMLPTNNNVPAR